MKNKKKIVILVMIIPILLACSFLGSTTPTPVSPKSYIEGIWVPSDYTLSYMQQLGYKFSSHYIEFKSNGVVDMVNIPTAWIFPQKNKHPGLFFW